MTPLPLSSFLIHLSSVHFILRSVSSSYTSKTSKPKVCRLWQYKTYKTAALQPGLTPFLQSLHGCFAFNTVTHSRKQPEYKSDSWVFYQTGALQQKKKHILMYLIWIFKTLRRVSALLIWSRQKWMTSWLTFCIRMDWIHWGSQKGVQKIHLSEYISYILWVTMKCNEAEVVKR